ncbi:MAG TPA: UbiA family prenyltransferase [Nannocystaceae bacterium]|nr:UbiA family prenyltransferase [Nannocystaceae bacterium]
MTPALFLRLGRVSNLPTVATNAMAGYALAGGVPALGPIAMLAIAAALLYVAGMVLNDVYDADLDAKERPERPIPAGLVTRSEARTWGFALLAAGVIVAAIAGRFAVAVPTWAPALAAATTAGLVVVYDAWHENNPVAPVVMGLCRAGVYAIGASAVASSPSSALWTGALLLCMYVVSLTYVAKFEASGALGRTWPVVGVYAPGLWAWRGASWPVRVLAIAQNAWAFWAASLARRGDPVHTRRAVVSLIAGISLVDAAFIARAGHLGLACVAVAAFAVTLVLQRRIAGT